MKKFFADILWALEIVCALAYLFVLGLGICALTLSNLEYDGSAGVHLVAFVLVVALISEFSRTAHKHVYVPIRDLIKNF